jgi:hypothetical protein
MAIVNLKHMLNCSNFLHVAKLFISAIATSSEPEYLLQSEEQSY